MFAFYLAYWSECIVCFCRSGQRRRPGKIPCLAVRRRIGRNPAAPHPHRTDGSRTPRRTRAHPICIGRCGTGTGPYGTARSPSHRPMCVCVLDKILN